MVLLEKGMNIQKVHYQTFFNKNWRKSFFDSLSGQILSGVSTSWKTLVFCWCAFRISLFLREQQANMAVSGGVVRRVLQ